MQPSGKDRPSQYNPTTGLVDNMTSRRCAGLTALYEEERRGSRTTSWYGLDFAEGALIREIVKLWYWASIVLHVYTEWQGSEQADKCHWEGSEQADKCHWNELNNMQATQDTYSSKTTADKTRVDGTCRYQPATTSSLVSQPTASNDKSCNAVAYHAKHRSIPQMMQYLDFSSRSARHKLSNAPQVDATR